MSNVTSGVLALVLSMSIQSFAAVVHNKGIGGENSTEGRKRFDAVVIKVKPAFAFIYYGLNDTLNEKKFVSLEDYLANIEWMILQCQSAGIAPVLCTIHPAKEAPLLKRHPREVYGEEGPNKKIDRYNKALKELAAKHSVPVADFAAETKKKGINLVVSEDGVHLTKEGNKVLAELFLTSVGKPIPKDAVVVCIGDSVTNGSGLKEAGTATGDTYPGILAALIEKQSR